MASIDSIKAPIKNELKTFETFFSTEFRSDVQLVNIISNYILRQKGKQIRPILTLLTAKLNGEINNSSYVAATLIELLHTATLVHDDVVDESYIRRGMFSINALWKSKAAVLFGDYLLSRGLLISLKHQEYKILEIVSNAVKEMSEGELLQIQSSRKSVISQENYFSIIKYKTASLFKACTNCGAASSTEDIEKIEQMSVFGENLGIAFQIKDDLLDIDSLSNTGKPANNDLKDKKFTLPIILSLQDAPRTEVNRTLKLIHKKTLTSTDIQHINGFIIQYNGIKNAYFTMQFYKNNALQCLDKYENSDTKKALIELINFTIERKK
jgi:octaprenyl-diphosphate synthase